MKSLWGIFLPLKILSVMFEGCIIRNAPATMGTRRVQLLKLPCGVQDHTLHQTPIRTDVKQITWQRYTHGWTLLENTMRTQ